MTPPTLPDLAEIKARLDAASPGPWRALRGEKQRPHEDAARLGLINTVPAFPLVLANNEHVLGELSAWTVDADRALIVHARRDMERLYAEVLATRFMLLRLLAGEASAEGDARHYLATVEGVKP